MADRIKGITIEIGGDTTKLSKALSGVNKEISTTQSQLKDVQRLLKLDPQNITLLEQKQKMLGKAIADTAEKLKTLESAEKQVQQQFKEGKVSQEQYNALEREIESTRISLENLKETEKQVQAQLSTQKTSNTYFNLKKEVQETENHLKELKKAEKEAQNQFKKGEITQRQYQDLQTEIRKTADELEKLKKKSDEALTAMGSKLKGAGKSVSDFGNSLMPVSATAAGVGAAGLKVAADFEKGMSEVKAITQASEEDFERLRQKAIELGASTAFSSKEVANAMTEMAKAGWGTDQIIDGMEGVLAAASASGESLGTVSTIIADAITGFGLSASDSARVADLLTQAANAGTISISDLGETMKYVAPLGQSMGFSIEDVVTAITAMSKAGIKGEQAGTSLRASMLNMANPTDNAAAAMDRLGLQIVDQNGKFKSLDEILTQMRTGLAGYTQEEQAAILSTISGKTAYSGLQAALNLTQEKYDEITKSMRDSQGVATQTAAVMQENLSNKIEQLGGALESLSIVLADNVIPWMTEMTIKATEWIEGFTQMDEGTQKVVLGIGAFLIIIGPLLVGIGKIITAIGTIITLIPKIGTAAGLLKTGLTTSFTFITKTLLPGLGNAFSSVFSFIISNPITLLIAAIVALVTLIATKGDEIQAILQKVDDFLQNAFVKDWTEVFGPTLGGIMNGAMQTIKDIWDGIKKIFDGVIDFIRGVFTGDWERAWKGVTEIFDGIFSTIEGIAKAPINAVIGLINGMIGAINWAIDGINSLSFDVPDWVPGIGGESWGFNLPNIPDIPYLAKGGILSRGSAIVGEAGPELLTLAGGKAIVQPLTGGTVVNQKNYFNNYQPRDGQAAVRDLNRQLGWEY
ncbi:phage tail tape measure protein [Negativibacillus massiliensis]|uniref:phage tail tape measure protein n=1 Tax=Negativibacillus massiliensis TaxID=1871035 RepID=UPI0023F72F8F|nr:phage tail tape measure protein [Negativibacillus massiliensis]